MIAKMINRLRNKMISKLYLNIYQQKKKVWRLYKLLAQARKSLVLEKQRRLMLENSSREKYLQGWKDHEDLTRRTLPASKIFVGPKSTFQNINQLHTR